ncbi:hypothetical protein ACFL6U_11025 [Planctomycetota bacterium]
MNTKCIFIATILLIIFCGVFTLDANQAKGAVLDGLVSSSDYGYLWWANGYHVPKGQGKKSYCFQSGVYGFVFDTERIDFTNFGKIDKKYTASQAAAQDNSIVYGLDKSELIMTVEADGKIYKCAGQTGIEKKRFDKSGPKRNPGIGYGNKNVPQRIISNGRYMQRFDVFYLQFIDSADNMLDAEARIEVIAWPDSMMVILEVIPDKAMKDVSLSVDLKAGGKTFFSSSSKAADVPAGKVIQHSDKAVFVDQKDGSMRFEAWDENGKKLNTEYDAVFNAYVVDIPGGMLKKGKFGDEPVPVDFKIRNASDKVQTARLFFRTDSRSKQGMSIIGTTPVLADSSGKPLGVGMQISKNWHRLQDKKMLYEGSWYHAYTVVHLQPGRSYDWKYMLVNGVWGNVPSVSHAQLCLIGWGGFQLWDQVAIGNWGETITYDPEVGLNRAIIDDVRPLMVSSKGSRPNVKWGWTNNVGGGDFLVYYDKAGKQQMIKALKSNYEKIGPNLSSVTYSGFTADDAITCKMTVMTPRCDDVNRNWHKFRYDVLKPVEFSRLAFYQLGADQYNDNLFEQIAIGDSSGLIKQFAPEMGGWKYSVNNQPFGDKLPWCSMLGEKPVRNPEERKGAMANRGLIVRSWKARLGGKEVSVPAYSIYGTDNHSKCALFELSAPESVKKLLPGDFVECEVELVILPQFADDYYGPNENLKHFMAENEGTYKPMYREAIGNDLNVFVSAGKLIGTAPLLIAIDSEQKAKFKVTGGLGYVPMTFTGLDVHKNIKFSEIKNGKAVDFADNKRYQSNYDASNKTWTVTFNIDLDSENDKRVTREFELVIER